MVFPSYILRVVHLYCFRYPQVSYALTLSELIACFTACYDKIYPIILAEVSKSCLYTGSPLL